MGGCDEDEYESTGACPKITNFFTRYNMDDNTWFQLTDAPRPRYRYMAAEVDGKIYYIGGRDLSDDFIPEVDVFDIGDNSWVTLDDQGGVTNISDGAAFVYNQKIFITGGYTKDYASLASTILLDTTATPLLFTPSGIDDKTFSCGDNGAVTIDDASYVFGGFTDTDFCNPLDVIEKFDHKTGTWSSLAPFRTGGRADMAFAVLNRHIFIIGGESKQIDSDETCNTSISISFVEMYDVDNEESTVIRPLDVSKFRFVAAADPDKKIIFTFGGQTSLPSQGKYDVLDTVEYLDVSSYFTTPQPPPSDSSSFRNFGSLWMVVLISGIVNFIINL